MTPDLLCSDRSPKVYGTCHWDTSGAIDSRVTTGRWHRNHRCPPGNSSLNHRASHVTQSWGRTPGSDLYKPNCREPYWNTLFAMCQFLKFCMFFAVCKNCCKNIFPAFYGARRFITAFKSSRYLSLSWARSIQSLLPHLTPWSSSLILSSHLRLGLASLFPSCFLSKTLYTPLLSPIRSTCPVLYTDRLSYRPAVRHSNHGRYREFSHLQKFRPALKSTQLPVRRVSDLLSGGEATGAWGWPPAFVYFLY